MSKPTRNLTQAIGLVVCCAIAGCNSPRVPVELTPNKKLQAELDQTVINQKEIAIPTDITEALLPKADLNLNPKKVDVEERYDISVKDMSATEFYMNLVDGTPFSVLIHPSVKGNVSLNLKNATIEDVMTAMERVYGFNYRRTELGYEVLPYELRTKTYSLDYLNIARSGSSSMQVSAVQVLSSSSDESSDDDSSEEVQSSNGSEVNTSSSYNFWTTFQATLEAMVADKPGQTVVINPNSGMIVVRAFPAEHAMIAEFIRITQEIIQRQVVIEAKIIEVDLSDGFQAGINWAVFTNGGKVNIAQVNSSGLLSGEELNSTVGGSLLSNTAGSFVQGSGIDFVTQENVSSNTAFSGFGGVVSSAIQFSDFQAMIELLKSQGNVQVLSSPRISTVNNQKAIIKVGTDEFFVTDVKNTVTGTSGDTVQQPEITFTPYFSGIALDVTPQIGYDGTITLHIHPTVSQVSEVDKNVTIGNSQKQTIPLAKRLVRETDSIVKAENGQVVIIGGLMKNTVDELEASLPVLGDLPFVGSMFRQVRQNDRKSELVILLKPIVANYESLTTELMKTNDRLKKLNRGFHYGGSPEVFGYEAEQPWLDQVN